jgi:hypothetical protein
MNLVDMIASKNSNVIIPNEQVLNQRINFPLDVHMNYARHRLLMLQVAFEYL